MSHAETALIVDDSTSMRTVLRITLQDAGFTVVEASNGQEALEQARRQNFDIVITDLNMPVMNGIDLIKALREIPAYRFTPILTLTNIHTGVKKDEVRQAGATGWVQKPFAPQSLVNAIHKVAA